MKKIYLALLSAAIAGIAGISACVSKEEKSDSRPVAEAPAGNHRQAPAQSDGRKEAAKNGNQVRYAGLETVGLPAHIPSQVKEYEGFTVSFNKDNGTPNYVAWELLAAETTGAQSRSNNFWYDEELEGCPTTNDYKRSGYDRGHMCPAADQKWSQKAMEECFVMSNMCPQDHGLNSGAWATLESKERQWAMRDSVIYIVAGPLYDASDKKRIGDAGVRVPSAFFKVMIAPYVKNPRGIGFVYPNGNAPGNMQNYSMSIDDVEALTGFDFFPSLPDELETLIEQQASFREWNR